MTAGIHEFDNGVRVYDQHLMPAQRLRYRLRNVHEADEEDLFVRVVSRLPEDGCFVNIGTAIGYYAILAKKLSPRLHVHAVEPLQSFRDCFRENIKLNGLADDDFVVHQCAVGAVDGRAAFLEKGYESQLLLNRNAHGYAYRIVHRIKDLLKAALGWLGVKRYAAGLGRKSEVTTITLDRLVDKVGRPIDVMSMDVQGLEVDILNGGKTALDGGVVKTFIIGTHGKTLHRQCVDVLTQHDYVIEYDNANTENQPDGIIIASRGVTRLV